jgi:hypothetical protein
LELDLGRDSSYAVAVKLWTKEQQDWAKACILPGYQILDLPVKYRSVRKSDIGKWLMQYDDFTDPICAMVKPSSEINDYAYVFITTTHVVLVYHEF